MASIYAARAAHQSQCCFVMSPRGTLSESALKVSKWKKTLAWGMVRRVIESADCVHATSEQEYDDIRRSGFRQPVAVIPNGIKVPVVTEAQVNAQATSGGERTLLYLGRFHPIKGLENLLYAWKNVEQLIPNWRLRLVGLDDGGYLIKLKELSALLRLKSITFERPVFNNERFTLYHSADAYILPSFSENFGLTVAEALACACPVIVSTGAPWAKVVENKCGWWIEPTVTDISRCLLEVCALATEELAQYGARGKAWVGAEFRWDNVAKSMLELYRWLDLGGATPSFIRKD